MPEGDSVARLSRRLQPLVGRTIEHSDFRVPRLATVDLTGTVITRVWPRGKHLFRLLTVRQQHHAFRAQYRALPDQTLRTFRII